MLDTFQAMRRRFVPLVSSPVTWRTGTPGIPERAASVNVCEISVFSYSPQTHYRFVETEFPGDDVCRIHSERGTAGDRRWVPVSDVG